MIKIKRSEKPEQLTEELQKQLTEEFKKNKEKNVWNKTFIREKLLEEIHLVLIVIKTNLLMIHI